MISQDQYDTAVKAESEATEVVTQYHKEQLEAFSQRLKDNPVFTEDELRYSARNLCPCGYGLAYPTDCGPMHYWDCSAILRGMADTSVKHTDQLPFAFYSIKSESDRNGTTRDVYRPQPEKPEAPTDDFTGYKAERESRGIL